MYQFTQIPNEVDTIMIPILQMKTQWYREATNECHVWPEGTQFVIFEDYSSLSLPGFSYAELYWRQHNG